MKKSVQCLSVLLFLSLTSSVHAQFDEREAVIVNDGYPGGIIETKKLEKSDVIEGSFFINNNWSVGNVLLYNGNAINGMPLKYNLRDEMLLLLDHNKISRVIRDDQIARFNWFDIEKNKNVQFVNCLDYELNDTPIVGFMEVLVDGKTELLLYRKLILQKGYYSITHDAGQLNDEYTINEYMYLASDKKLIEAKGKNTLLEYFADHANDMKSYIKSNNLRIKVRDDLGRIVKYYNELREN